MEMEYAESALVFCHSESLGYVELADSVTFQADKVDETVGAVT